MLKFLKKLFTKKKLVEIKQGELDAALIGFNDASLLVHQGGRICVGLGPLDDYYKRLEQITRVIGKGHESVLEHSNIVNLISVPVSMRKELLEITPVLKFLNVKLNEVEDTIFVLLGGSIRGYKHIFRESINLNNPVIDLIKDQIYISAEKEFYSDLIEANIMDETKFLFQPKATLVEHPEDYSVDYVTDKKDIYASSTFDILNIDDLLDMYEKVKEYGFTKDDLLDMCSISILFHDVSRIITQQMVRHRVGISQESQRYVDYSAASFVDPCKFKPEKYDLNKKYSVKVFGTSVELTSQELGEAIIEIYPQLLEQGLLKEDARGFLPLNVKTQLIMTFTFRQLFNFLNMRCGKGAQSENRFTAIALESYIKSFFSSILDKDIYDYLDPKYLLEYEKNMNLYADIDEPVGEEVYTTSEALEGESTDEQH